MDYPLITGGSGFIGSYIYEEIKKNNGSDGSEVAVLDTTPPKDFEFNGKFISADIRDGFAVMQAVYDCDVIFHVAGVLGTLESFDDPYMVSDINIAGGLRVFDAAKTMNKPVVNLSLGNPWANPYMITKRTVHEFAQMYNEAYKTKITTLTGRNAYGPRQKWSHVRKVVPTFIVNALRNEDIRIWGDGEQIIDLIHAADMARACVIAAKKKVPDVIDLGTGIPTTVKKLAEIIIGLTDSKSDVKFLPMRKGEPLRSVTLADMKKAKDLLNFEHKICLEDGLKETIPWYREKLNDPNWNR